MPGVQNALEHKYICDKYRVVAVMDSQRYFKDMISGPVKIMKTTLVNVHFMLGSKMFHYLEYSEILQSIE